MSHRTAAIRNVRDLLLAVYAGLFAIFATLIYIGFGKFNFLFTGGLSAIGTGLVGLRARDLIKASLVKASERDACDLETTRFEQQQERYQIFGMACVEVAKMMSKLSEGDLSVFISADKHSRTNKRESIRFKTVKGSPVHCVLVGMVDVEAARPIEMKRINPEANFVIAEYELTPWGVQALEMFLRDAYRYRSVRP